jgi:hypothetical protein
MSTALNTANISLGFLCVMALTDTHFNSRGGGRIYFRHWSFRDGGGESSGGVDMEQTGRTTDTAYQSCSYAF